METQLKKPKWINQIEVLVWDFDGTLYSEQGKIKKQIHKKVAKKIAEFKQIPIAQASLLFYKLYKKYQSSTQVMLNLGINKDYVLSGLWYNKAQLNNMKKDQKLIELFSKLEHKRHIMCTNSEKENTFKKLLKLGLKPKYFEKIFTNKDTNGRVKPDPYAFQLVLNYTKLKAKKHLFIGDSDGKEMIPAKKIGMKTCLVWGKSKIADINLGSVYEIASLF